MAVPVQPNFKGVHKSGYHSSVSDQYAAMVTPNKPKATSTRKFSVHERIQVLSNILTNVVLILPHLYPFIAIHVD